MRLQKYGILAMQLEMSNLDPLDPAAIAKVCFSVFRNRGAKKQPRKFFFAPQSMVKNVQHGPKPLRPIRLQWFLSCATDI